MQGEACVSCGRELQAQTGVLACAACGASQVPWKNRHRTTEEYGRLDLKPWRTSSNSASSTTATAAAAGSKKPPVPQPTQPARPPWKPVGRRANSAMFVKAAAAAADSPPPHVPFQHEKGADAALDPARGKHAVSAEVIDGDGKAQSEDAAGDGCRQEDKMEVTALSVYELGEVLGDGGFAGCSACVYLVHKQCFSKKRRSTTLADCIVSHRLLQGWCLRIDIVRQDGDGSGEEQLLLQRHVPESEFRLVTPSKLFLPLPSVDPMCPYMSQHLSDVLRPLVQRIHKRHEESDLAFDDTAARFGARIQWGSWFAPRYTPAAVTLKILHDRGAALVDGVVDQCEAEKFADIEAKDDVTEDNLGISEQLVQGLQLEVWPLQSRFGGRTILDISLQTLKTVAATAFTPINLHRALVRGDRRTLLQLARAVIAQYQFVNTLDGPLLVQSASLAEPGNSLQSRIIPWAEDMDDADVDANADVEEEAEQQVVETASEHEDDTVEIVAARTIERFVRGWLARRRVAELARRQQAEREEAQRRRWLQRRHEAAIVIQCMVRRRMAAQRLRALQQRLRFPQFEYEHHCSINATEVKLVAKFEGLEEAHCDCDQDGATCVRRSVLRQAPFQLKLQAFDEQSRQHSNEFLLPGSRVQALLPLLLPDFAATEEFEDDGVVLRWIVQQIAQLLTLFYSKANNLMVLALSS